MQARTYTKRTLAVSKIDEICFEIKSTLEEYKGLDSLRKFKKNLFKSYAEKNCVEERRLRYWYWVYNKKYTTKKRILFYIQKNNLFKKESGRSSIYKEYDLKIFEQIANISFNNKDMKKILKTVAIDIIRKDKPDFKCSETFLSRLRKRLDLIQSQNDQIQVNEECSMNSFQGMHYYSQYNDSTFDENHYIFPCDQTNQTQNFISDSSFFLSSQMTNTQNSGYIFQESQGLADTNLAESYFSWPMTEADQYINQNQQNVYEEEHSFSFNLSTTLNEEN